MKKYSVRKYEPADHQQWDAFIDEAKNATFLFYRGFMEYHSHRFEDFSLLIFENERLISVFPANRLDTSVYSHQGLTYGGLIYNDIKLGQSIEILRNLLIFLELNGIQRLHIKLIPTIYHRRPADEMNYGLFLAQAQRTRTDTLSVVDMKKTTAITTTRKQSIRRGVECGLEIRGDDNFDLFWNTILIPNLAEKHGAKPVHSIAEIQLLHSRFPENIRQFNVYNGNKIVAGTTIFVSENVAHAQYISADADKNKLGSLDYLHHHLLTAVFHEKDFFDFGISNEDEGTKLNSGLLFWKESFGARTITQDFYVVPTANYKLLENVLI
ncbi:MAG TPA: GNAT family N-acetyltransferase [Flavobacterium sp.]